MFLNRVVLYGLKLYNKWYIIGSVAVFSCKTHDFLQGKYATIDCSFKFSDKRQHKKAGASMDLQKQIKTYIDGTYI